MASARITVERGVVGFGLDYACAHIIIPVSVNLLPIQADFVTERVIINTHKEKLLKVLEYLFSCSHTGLLQVL